MENTELSDEQILRIWTRQAYDMGLIDTKIPYRKVGAHDLTAHERKRITLQAELAGAPNPFEKFRQQQYTAAKRGIEWEMTFLEWWGLWEPYFLQRGHNGHGLEMCRIGDKGPYKIGNVFLASGLENREMNQGIDRRKRRA